jgi:DNA (cytosine-5)-methyltransferase 1
VNVLSLFSGIGGLDLAAEWAGMRTVAFCERDKPCQELLRKRWPGAQIFDDVMTLKGSDLNEPVGLIASGFPCQPYSVAGEQLGNDDDRALWPENLRIIKEFRPTWFVGENVIGIVELALDNVLADLESIGYSARPFDIPASAVGAKIERRRVAIVAHSNGIRLQGGAQRPRMAKTYEQLQGLLPPGFRPTLSELRANRGSDGVPNRVDRLKQVGNAVNPFQFYPIFKAISDIERLAA